MGRSCSTNGKEEKYIRILVGKPEGESSLERSRYERIRL
jgi:hypothetical protein